VPESNHYFLEQLAGYGMYPHLAPVTPGRNGTVVTATPVPPPDTPAAHAYGAAALDSEARALAGTAEGQRNAALNRAAFRIGQLIPDYLSEQAADTDLTTAALTCGLGTAEIAATLASGLAAGQAARREVVLRAGAPPIYMIDTGENPTPRDSAADMGGDRSGTGGSSSPKGPENGLPMPLDWVTLFAGTRTEPDWLVPDVIERGRAHVLYASHKAGKSLTTLAWVAELATQGHHVLYLDFENSTEDLVERLRDDMGYDAAQLATLHYLSFPSMASLDTPAGGATLYALALLYQAELVVLDTTARVVSGEENSSDTYRHLYRYAAQPLKAAGIAVLRLDHAGKDPTAGQRGSSSKGDDVDTVWRLVRVAEHHVRLHCDAQRTGHHPPQVDYTLVQGPLRLQRVTDDPFSQPEVTALIDALDRLEVPATAGREVCRVALARAGIRVRNDRLARALNVRKVRLTSWDDLSGTVHSTNDLEEIHTTCPQDQQKLFETPGQTCPGQVGDSGDSSPGVPRAAPVPISVRPKGGQMGTGGQDLSGAEPPENPVQDPLMVDRLAEEAGRGRSPAGNSAPGALAEGPGPDPEDDPRRCPKCGRVAGEIRPMSAGAWRRLCVACAYPGGGLETTDNPTEE
jgi:hypothetical protein